MDITEATIKIIVLEAKKTSSDMDITEATIKIIVPRTILDHGTVRPPRQESRAPETLYANNPGAFSDSSISEYP